MPSNYPSQNDNFSVPTDPGSVPLGQRGDASRNHSENHRDLGDAIIALQENVSLLTHDHSGGTSPRSTPKLKQANTHESADTDKSAKSLHHTLGTGANQAAPGNHYHMSPVGHYIYRTRSYYGKTRPTYAEGRRTMSGLSTSRLTSSSYFEAVGSTGVRIKESGLYYISSMMESYSPQSSIYTSRWHRIRFAMPSGKDPQYPNIKSSHYRNNDNNNIVGIRYTNRIMFQADNIRWLPKGTIINIEAQSLSDKWELQGLFLMVVALFNRPGEPLVTRGGRDK